MDTNTLDITGVDNYIYKVQQADLNSIVTDYVITYYDLIKLNKYLEKYYPDIVAGYDHIPGMDELSNSGRLWLMSIFDIPEDFDTEGESL